MSTTTELPATLEEVPVAERLPESITYLPGAIGVVALVGAVGMLVGPHAERWRSDLHVVASALGLALLGALCLWGESKRRPIGTYLVRRGGRVGIYRHGKLESSAPWSEVMTQRWSAFNTGRSALIAICALPFIYMLLTVAVPDQLASKEPHFLPMLLALVVGLGFLVFGAIDVQYRLTRRVIRMRVPFERGGKPSTLLEMVALSRADASRLATGER